MINKKVQDSLNEQINVELYSAYLYLSMSACMSSLNFPGFTNWMRVQANEEMGHAMKIYDHVNGRNGRVILKQIEAPKAEWASPLEAFEAAYGHEKTVTGLINNLVDLASSEKDHATGIFLNWFVEEQVEEENSTNEVVQKLKIIKDSPAALIILDRELAGRKE